jgi:hypothetical protein
MALVSGACGPISQQNNYGEFAGKGLDSPQGLILHTAEGKASIVRDGQVKPRLAALLDYLWEGGKRLFEYIETPDSLGNVFSVHIDREFIASFGAWPVRTIKLHALTLKGKYVDCITMDVPGSGRSPLQAGYDRTYGTFQVNLRADKSLKEFYHKLGSNNRAFDPAKIIRAHLFFFSIYFTGSEANSAAGGKLAAYYDSASPYCFPAAMLNRGEYYSNKVLAPTYQRDTGKYQDEEDKYYLVRYPDKWKGGEVPDFEKLKKIAGYKTRQEEAEEQKENGK